ncbi:hypothetical protein K402DRAFT_175228 [Aulographum hederae CBS 113979]|uniref:Retrotransposon gag domain-containing protein n=1 Tax=Aulographum hederae CBS 113979 TaxID=1176131 RepID=A0A6G1GM34_9PEZI|nr:hypothetical protein K402DRAFT_216759 [Aulographum hederae CBS 113979]KAF1991313.1 hypothetical protein K402DRAFT_175228 [Aulographum hederae CBS 113979]
MLVNQHLREYYKDADEEDQIDFVIGCTEDEIFTRLNQRNPLNPAALLGAIPFRSLTELLRELNDAYAPKNQSEVAYTDYQRMVQSSGQSFEDFYTALDTARSFAGVTDDMVRLDLLNKLDISLCNALPRGARYNTLHDLVDTIRRVEIDNNRIRDLRAIRGTQDNARSSRRGRFEQRLDRRESSPRGPSTRSENLRFAPRNSSEPTTLPLFPRQRTKEAMNEYFSRVFPQGPPRSLGSEERARLSSDTCARCRYSGHRKNDATLCPVSQPEYETWRASRATAPVNLRLRALQLEADDDDRDLRNPHNFEDEELDEDLYGESFGDTQSQDSEKDSVLG